MHLETEALGRVPLGRLFGNKLRIDLEQNVGEGGTKVGAVNGGVAAGFGRVYVLAFGAVELDGVVAGDVG